MTVEMFRFNPALKDRVFSKRKDNAAECVQFVTNASGGVVIASKKHFFNVDRFYEECEPR